jgi:hypothetical protein
VWPLDAAIAETIAWYRCYYGGADMVSLSTQQIDRHIDRVGRHINFGAVDNR